jgi:hypothetical protein
MLVARGRRNLWTFVELSTPIQPTSHMMHSRRQASPLDSVRLESSIFRSDYGIPSATGLFEHARPLNTHNLVCTWRIAMRSKLVFRAMTQVSHRFLLVRLASKATRALHKPNSRIQETMNDVFVRFGQGTPITHSLDTDTVQLFDRAA